jgi:hypothetical protein
MGWWFNLVDAEGGAPDLVKILTAFALMSYGAKQEFFGGLAPQVETE